MNPANLRADEPLSPPAAATFFGARWAAGLGAALLVALALLTVARRVGKPATAAEEIVQIRPAATTPTPTPPAELLAPDPGDHP